MRDALQAGWLAMRPVLTPTEIPAVVERFLAAARAQRASDVHLIPGADGLEMLWRIDGVLHRVDCFPIAVAPNLIARLKVLAQLLTYRTDIPQEGRLTGTVGDDEVRLSTFPTVWGEKGVLRLFARREQYRYLRELNYPADVHDTLTGWLAETSGVILLTGPAGSGKTTALYAGLREILEQSGSQRSLVSVEDPVEVVVPGVAQSAVQRAGEFDIPASLRALLRQDPDVIAVGEIRDRSSAEMVFQASLTGHLVLTTFHAGSTARAVHRLLDMGIEPYLLRSGLLGVISQRLVRRLCACAEWSDREADRGGLPVERRRVPRGCPECQGTGYRHRGVLVELLQPDWEGVGPAIVERREARGLEGVAVAAGMVTLRDRGTEWVAEGWTSPAEIRRVLGGG